MASKLDCEICGLNSREKKDAKCPSAGQCQLCEFWIDENQPKVDKLQTRKTRTAT
jgi:hypothetical protein